jgi:hypothetical protein
VQLKVAAAGRLRVSQPANVRFWAATSCQLGDCFLPPADRLPSTVAIGHPQERAVEFAKPMLAGEVDRGVIPDDRAHQSLL